MIARVTNSCFDKWRDGARPMLQRMEAAWNPARMDALLLLHPIEKAIGREATDRGDYFVDADGRARHRGSAEIGRAHV